MPELLAPPPVAPPPQKTDDIDSALGQATIPPEVRQKIRSTFTDKPFTNGDQLQGFIDPLPVDQSTKRQLWDLYSKYQPPPPPPKGPTIAPEPGITDTLKGGFGAAWDIAKEAYKGKFPAFGLAAQDAKDALSSSVKDYQQKKAAENMPALPKPPSVQPVVPPKVPGMLEPGNISNLFDRTTLKNPDGSWSTTSSMSFEDKGKEVLIPTVVNGQRLIDNRFPVSDWQNYYKPAIDHYRQTGEHLGKFDTPDNADAYGTALHNAQASMADPSAPGFPYQLKQPLLEKPALQTPSAMLDVTSTTVVPKPALQAPGTTPSVAPSTVLPPVTADDLRPHVQKLPPVPKPVTSLDVLKQLPSSLTADVKPQDIYGSLVKMGAGLIGGITLGYYDPDTGTFQTPITGTKHQLRDRSLSQTLQDDWGVSPEIAQSGMADSIGSFVGSVVPWSAISRTLGGAINLTRSAATSALAESGAAQKTVKAAYDITNEILAHAGLQAATGAVYATLEKPPDQEQPADKAERIGKTALYGAGFSVLFDSVAHLLGAIPTPEKPGIPRTAKETVDKVTNDIYDIFYRSGRFTTEEQARAAADRTMRSTFAKYGEDVDELAKVREAAASRFKTESEHATSPGDLPNPPSTAMTPESTAAPSDDFDAVKGRLADASIADKAIEVYVPGNSPVRAIPLAGTRISGALGLGNISQEQADAVKKQLDGKQGFDNVRITPTGSGGFDVIWGADVPTYQSSQGNKFAQAIAGRMYGYDPASVQDFTGISVADQDAAVKPWMDSGEVKAAFPPNAPKPGEPPAAGIVKDGEAIATIPMDGKDLDGTQIVPKPESSVEPKTVEPEAEPENPNILPPPDMQEGLGPRWYMNKDLGSTGAGEGIYWLDGTDEEDAKAGIAANRDGTFTVETQDGRKSIRFNTLKEAAAAAEQLFPQIDVTPGAPPPIAGPQQPKLPAPPIPKPTKQFYYREGNSTREVRGTYQGQVVLEDGSIVAPKDSRYLDGLTKYKYPELNDAQVEGLGGTIPAKTETIPPKDETKPEIPEPITPPDETKAAPVGTVNRISDNELEVSVTAPRQVKPAEAIATAKAAVEAAGHSLDEFKVTGTKATMVPTRGGVASTNIKVSFERAAPKPEVPAPPVGRYSVQPTGDGQFGIIDPQGKTFPRQPFTNESDAQKYADSLQSRFDKMAGTPAKTPETTKGPALPPPPGKTPTVQRRPSRIDLIKKGLVEAPTDSKLDDLKKKLAAAPKDRIIPKAIDDFISEMKTSEGRAAAGMDPRIVKVLGGNLYTGNLGVVAMREMLQNSLDSVREIANGTGGHIRFFVDTKNSSVTVRDDGAGMLPDVAQRELLDIGGSKKAEGSSGGFGIAKVAIFANAESISITTTAKDNKGRVIRTKLNGSGVDWADPQKGLKVETGQVADSEPTGTEIRIGFTPNVHIDSVNSEHFAKNVLESWHMPAAISFDVDGTTVDLAPAPTQKVYSFQVPGANVDVYVGNQQIDATYGIALGSVLNNGLFQFKLSVGDVPNNIKSIDGPILMDVRPTGTPEEPNYPFSPDRQQLRTYGIAEKVRDFVNENIVTGAIGREMGRYQKAIEDAPVVGSGGEKVIDTTGNIDKEFVRELAERPYLRKIVDAISESIDETIDQINRRRSDKIEFPEVGIGLGQGYLGVNIKGESVGQEHNIVLINNYLAAEEIDWVIADGAAEESDRAPMIAGQIVGTVIHEVSHQAQRNHDEKFAGELTRNIGRTGRPMTALTYKIQSILEDDNNAALDALTADLKRLKTQWGGEDIFRKVVAGTAGSSEHPGDTSHPETGAIGWGRSGEAISRGSGSPASFMESSAGPEPSDADLDTLDDETLDDLLTLGAYTYQAAPDYEAWAKEMAADGRDWMRPYLPMAYNLIDNVAAATGKKPATAPAPTDIPEPPKVEAEPRGPPEGEPQEAPPQTSEPPKVETPAPAPAPAVTKAPIHQLAERVRDVLKSGQSIDNPALTRMANDIFGGARGEGAYTPKMAYDAAEAGLNMLIQEPGIVDFNDIPGTLKRLREIVARMPTQSDRTDEQVSLQQFSTPPEEAFAATIAAAIHPGMIGLEPSAGTGNIAVMMKMAGAAVQTNEYSERRRGILEILGFPVSGVDALHLNSLLNKSIQPDVIVMNPPFSSSAGKTNTNKTEYGAKHVTEALARLKDGGRVVAIVGGGMGHDRVGFQDWWTKIEQKYNVRANIGIDGKYYAKYGTGFDNQILVIDKTGPTPGVDRAERVSNIIRGSGLSPEEAINLLIPLSKEDVYGRIKGIESAGQPTSKPPLQPKDRPGPAPAPGSGGSPAGGSRPELQPTSGGIGTDGGGLGGVAPTGATGTGDAGTRPVAGPREPGELPNPSAAGETSGVGGEQGVAGAQPPAVEPAQSGLEAGEQSSEIGQTEDEIYDRYVVKKATFKGSVKHPANIVESATMASVEPPDVSYKPNIPTEVVTEGRLSDVQMEAITYAGQRHSTILPSGKRAGFWLGDGMGIGKGRQVAGIIYDNLRQGRKRAVWMSINADLAVDAKRDMDGIGIPMKLLRMGDTKAGNALPDEDGVMFAPYSTVTDDWKSSKHRFNQLTDWLGEDFDGVIAFDEAHKMKGALGTTQGGAVSTKTGTDTGAMGIALSQLYPNARIVYVSATGATVPRNMAYMDRLGLWGPGAPFGGFMDFLSAIDSGGVGAMEMLARDLKAVGTYQSRTISYAGVDYDTITHNLTPDEIASYDNMAAFWNEVAQAFDTAMQNSGQPRGAGNQLSQFHSSQLRFFLQVMTSLQLPDLFAAADKDLEAGRSVVINLFSTNEGQVKKKVNKAVAAGVDLDDIDFTPREILVDLIDKFFPIHEYETVTDPATGTDTQVQVKDEHGNPVTNPENEAMRDELLERVANMAVPDNPLDAIIAHFGHKNVSEMSGRKKRFENGKYVNRKIEGVKVKDRDEMEVKRFQEGITRVAVMTAKAAVGISLHADRSAKNQQRRSFYAMQLSWSADQQMQGFGRVHRSNQASAPMIHLVRTNLRGQERLINTISARLAMLGAITKGGRETLGGGVFDSNVDLTDRYGVAALGETYQEIRRDRIPGIVAGPQLLQRMGVMTHAGVIGDQHLGNVQRFLNRIMGLPVAEQNTVFDVFFDKYLQAVQMAKAAGTFDVGVRKIRGQDMKLLSEPQTVYTHPESGAKTQLVEMEGDFPLHPVKFDDSLRNEGFKGHFINNRSSRLYAVSDNGYSPGGMSYRMVAPTGKEHAVTAWNDEEFRKNHVQVLPTEARPRWDKEFAEAPKTEKQKINLLTGAIYPIYDRVIGGDDGLQHTAVARAVLADGTSHVGLQVFASELGRLKQRLGIGTTLAKADGKQVYDLVHNGATIELDNGWKIRMTKVHGEPRMEVDGRGRANPEEMKNHGLIAETLDFKRRYFVPLDDDQGPQVLNSVLKLHNAVRDETSRTQPDLTAGQSGTQGGQSHQVNSSIGGQGTGIPDAVSGPTVGQQFIAGGRSAQLPSVPMPPESRTSITINGDTYKSEPVNVELNGKLQKIHGYPIVPGLAVTESVSKKGSYVVTHTVSGMKITEPSTLARTIATAKRLATVGDWTRSAADMRSDRPFVEAVQKKLTGEKGAINFWRQKPPDPIPPGLVKSPIPETEDLLRIDPNARGDIWQEIRNIKGRGERFANSLQYNGDVKAWPVFAERMRRSMELRRQASAYAQEKVAGIVKGLSPEEERAANRIVILEDLYETAARVGDDRIPLALNSGFPDKLTQIDGEINRLKGIATPNALNAVDKWHDWMTEMHDELVRRGKMSPDSGFEKYYPNQFLHANGNDNLPGLPHRLRDPRRDYTKERKGHVIQHDPDWIRVGEKYGTRFSLDNLIDDFIDNVAAEHDFKQWLTPAQTQQLLAETKGVLKPEGHRYTLSTANLTPAQIKTISTAVYGGPGFTGTLPAEISLEGFQREPGRVLYPATAINEPVITDAVDAGMAELIADLEPIRRAAALAGTTAGQLPRLPDIETNMGEPLTHQVLVVGGQHKIYLLPSEIAHRLKNFRQSGLTGPMTEMARAATQVWKASVIHFSGLAYYGTVTVGNMVTAWAEDIGSLAKWPAAMNILRKKLPPSQYQLLLQLADDAALWNSVFYTGNTHSITTTNPELRQYRPPQGLARINPFGENVIGDFLRELQRKGQVVQTFPKLAKLMADLERVQNGQPPVNKSVLLRGMDPNSMLALGKIARESIHPDYKAQALAMRGAYTVFPFAPFHIMSIAPWLRRAIYKKWLFPSDYFLAAVGSIYLAQYLWNHMMFPDDEKALPDWQKHSFHIITGLHHEDGTPVVIGKELPPEGTLGKFLGLDTISANLDRVKSGQWTLQDAAEQQLKDMALGGPTMALQLLHPVLLGLGEIMANKDALTGREIVPTGEGRNLYGDKTKAFPQTETGKWMMAEHFAKRIIAPYMQAVRASQMLSPDTTMRTWMTETGPFGWMRAFGVRSVDPTQTATDDWQSDGKLQDALKTEKMRKLIDLDLAVLRNDITPEGYARAYGVIDDQAGVTPTNAEITAFEAKPSFQILIDQDQLRKEVDPKVRQGLYEDIRDLREKISMDEYLQMPKWLRQELGSPPSGSLPMPPSIQIPADLPAPP